jgi:hypothetical protein
MIFDPYSLNPFLFYDKPSYTIADVRHMRVSMDYWLDLFTGTTWNEFREAGAKVSGFRSTRQKIVNKIKPGDILLCYLTGVMRWVGALEVIGPSKDISKIWEFDDFQARAPLVGI